jgi:hypothetical protein
VTAQYPGAKELEGLLVDDGEPAIDGLLRRVLEPYVRLTREGRLITTERFLSLSDPNKILVFLLGRRAMIRLNIPNAAAEASADVLHSECGVPLKSCREYLSRLKARRLLERNEKGYFVPGWAISAVAAAVEKTAAS